MRRKGDVMDAHPHPSSALLRRKSVQRLIAMAGLLVMVVGLIVFSPALIRPTPAHAAGILLSQGQPPTASSVQTGTNFVAANAVDGNSGTRWSSAASDPQWLQVDLGSAQSICGVNLQWETAYATAYQIQVSTDAANWTNIYSTTTGQGGTVVLTVSGTGRYVRMYGTQRATQYGYSLWEFQVFASPSNPTPTPPSTPTPTPT